MRGIRDADIFQLVKYSYMDLSAKKDYKGYALDVDSLIRNKTKIGDTDIFLGMQNGYDKPWSLELLQPQGDDHIRFNFKKNLEEIRENSNLNKLILIGHINDDKKEGNENGTGLVAYALQNIEDNEIYFLCRGSEGGIFSFVPDWVEKIKKKKWAEIFKAEDWRDNFNMIFHDSTNFKPLKSFAEGIIKEYGSNNSKYSVFGHSKGGGLAIYLAALFEGMDGTAVDGVGLPINTFLENVNFIAALRQSNIRNIIAENDIVGKMLVHFEKRVYVKMHSTFNNEKGETVNPNEVYAFALSHYPDAIFFDENGMVITTKKKRFLPLVIGIINNLLMIMILFDKLSEGEKLECNETVESLKDKSIKVLDSLCEA